MKKTLAGLVVLLVSACFAGALSAQTADEMMKTACITAAKENKKVFVIFHASWCGWCHKMDKSMKDETCKKYFDDNFVILHFVVDEADDKKNLETPGAAAFRTRYDGDKQGLPLWYIFDKDGHKLADSMKPEPSGGKSNVGCPAQDDEVSYFIDILKSTTGLQENELQKIRERFSKNKG